MKVLNCPICRITPEITATEIKCPKCGKTAKGYHLNDTVSKWNGGEYTTVSKAKVVIEEVPVEKEEPKKPVEKAEKAPKKAEKVKKPIKKATKRSE